MPPETHSAPGDVVYQRAYAAIVAQALCHTGYWSAIALQTLKFSAGPDVVDRILLHLQTADLLQIAHDPSGTSVYDFLPLLEKQTLLRSTGALSVDMARSIMLQLTARL